MKHPLFPIEMMNIWVKRYPGGPRGWYFVFRVLEDTLGTCIYIHPGIAQESDEGDVMPFGQFNT